MDFIINIPLIQSNVFSIELKKVVNVTNGLTLT